MIIVSLSRVPRIKNLYIKLLHCKYVFPRVLKLANSQHPPSSTFLYSQSPSFHDAPHIMTKHHARPISSPLLPWQQPTPMDLCVSYSSGRWLAGRGTPEAWPLSRVGCGRGKVNAV